MEYFKLFFDANQSLGVIEKGVYQPHLVLLAYAIASFGAYVALSMMLYMMQSRTRGERTAMHWAGAFAMAAGIWGMHFIGMLSYKMDMVVEYDLPLTLLSFLIAFGVAYGAFSVVVARRGMHPFSLCLAAVLLGFGICAMHYTGMAAMRMDGALRYRPDLFSLSVVVAIAAAGAALFIVFRLRRWEKHVMGAKVLAHGDGACDLRHALCRYRSRRYPALCRVPI